MLILMHALGIHYNTDDPWLPPLPILSGEGRDTVNRADELRKSSLEHEINTNEEKLWNEMSSLSVSLPEFPQLYINISQRHSTESFTDQTVYVPPVLQVNKNQAMLQDTIRQSSIRSKSGRTETLCCIIAPYLCHVYKLQLHVVAPSWMKCQHAVSFWLRRGWINVCTFGGIICFLWRTWVILCTRWQRVGRSRSLISFNRREISHGELL